MGDDLIWPDRADVERIHEEQLREHGGGAGLRDEALLESALAKPRNLVAYGDPTLAEIAASYAFGLAKNHAFIDGNKRTSLVVTETFLALNGFEIIAGNDEVVRIWQGLAAGEIGEADLAEWIARNLVPAEAVGP